MEKQLRTKDVRDERSFVDRWGFMAFAVIGSVVIVASKYLNFGQTITTIFALSSLAIYAGIIFFAGTGKLRSDQAGDNCYYLGLIFTLVSLGYAIFTFDPADTATTIVQGFGIALATTIAGLILRVFFNQYRVDLNEVEDTARLELADAVGEFKSQLSDAARQFSSLSRGCIQMIDELREQTEGSVSGATRTAAEGIQETTKAAQKAISQSANGYLGNAKQFETAMEGVLKAIEGHGERLGSLAGQTESLGVQINAMDNAAATFEKNAQRTSEAVEMALAVIDSSNKQVDHLTGSQQEVRNTIATLSSTVERIDGVLSEQIASLRDAPRGMFTTEAHAISDLATSLQSELARIVNEIQAVVTGVAAHNQALDAELEKSRENTSRVHSALVEMTAQITREVREGGT